jgi:DnaJ family protein A protein 2
MVKETELYELLGVEVTVDEGGLKRAYRKLALKYHPDKNQGDNDALEMFKKIGYAYEILSDTEKRSLYDRHGKKGLEQGGGGDAHDANDIFSMFFGGGSRGRGEPKPKDIVHELAVSLEDTYLGKSKKIAAIRDRLCDACDAEGFKAGAQRDPCGDCGGRGVRMVMQQVFPGMVQRGQVRCPSCEGQGMRVRPSDLCGKCQGKKTIKEKKILEVHIEKGMKKGDHIRFNGEGDQIPGVKLSGDILLVIAQKPHDMFRRVGSHLIMQHDISLQEALCGFELPIQHLDGRTVVVKIAPGQVADPNHAWTVHREGMPVPNTGGVERGNLVLQFNVTMPKLSAAARTAVAQALSYSPAQQEKHGSTGTKCSLTDYVEQPKRKSRRGGRQMAHDDDDDDDHGPRGGGGGGAQCQQQ